MPSSIGGTTGTPSAGGGFGGATLNQLGGLTGGAPFNEQIDLNISGYRVVCPVANREYASVQTTIISAAYGTGVLTIKGSLDGDAYISLGEPTITADGIYGPLYIAGLQLVCVEVTATSAASALVRACWRSWGSLK